jgi:hypothetical protein
VVGSFQELLKARGDSGLTAIKEGALRRIFSLRKPHGVFQQAGKLFTKGLPLGRSVGFIHFGQLGEQS